MAPAWGPRESKDGDDAIWGGRMRFRTWAPVAVATLLVTTFGGPAGAASVAPTATAVPAFAPDVRSPAAEVTAEANDASGILMSYVDEHPDRYTGVSITGARSILVTLPGGADVAGRLASARQALATAAPAVAPSVSVAFAKVRHSRAQLSKLKESVVQVARTEYRGSVVGVGEDPALGAVVVYLKTRAEQPRITLNAKYGDAVIFRYLPGEMRFVEGDRNRDPAPHRGGAGFRMWDGVSVLPDAMCSTAFPVIVSGVTYMLTAGHCAPGHTTYSKYWASAFTAPGTQPPSSFYFGDRATTTISGTIASPQEGTQDLYGDWAIMRGSQYAPAVYNCTNQTGDCSTLKIGAGFWTTPAMRTGVCISGRMSGQVCRFFITDNMDVTDGGPYGLEFRHVAIIQHDTNLDGVYDCVPVQHGDSGGAVYRALAGRPGYVQAMGTISSVMGDGCSSMYTKLSGLKAWNASATMPLAP
jgi:hypothetical protein